MQNEDRTSKLEVGGKLEVTHNGRGCGGGVASVTKASEVTFTAECRCGWRFAGMQSDRYPRVAQ